ncbi:MAG: FUSC family protein [Devosia sp.]
MNTNGPYHRRHVFRDLLNPRRLQDTLSLARQPSLRNTALAGLQAAITIAIALPLTLVSPYPHLIGFVSLGALVALFGRFAPGQGRLRVLVLCALCQVLAVFGMSFAAWLGTPFTIQLALLALSCGLFLFISLTGKFGPPGALIFVFAAAASMSTGTNAAEVLERTAATAVSAILALAICAVSEVFRHHPNAERPFPTDPDLPVNHRRLMAARAAFGSGIAVFASYALGANYPAWAAMGALAVLQGTHLQLNLNRAVQRMAGTAAGAVLAWALLVQDPSVWILIAVLALLQFLTEVVIGTNYALGQVLVTPMALLMTHLAAPEVSGPEMAPERVLDTIVGAVVGICIAVLLSSLDDRRRLGERTRKHRDP